MSDAPFTTGTNAFVETQAHLDGRGIGRIHVTATAENGYRSSTLVPIPHPENHPHIAAIASALHSDPIHITQKYSNRSGTVRTFDVTT